MNKYKLNILISILSVMAIFMIYFLGGNSTVFILAMIFVGAYYIGNNNIKNKVIKKILEIISATLFLIVTVIAFFFIITIVINIIAELPNLTLESFDSTFMVVSIYFLFRIGIDAFRDYKKKKFEFAGWLRVITLAVINLVMLRLLVPKLFIGLEDPSLFVDQNGSYFFIMLASCMISTIDFSKKIKIKLEDILKLLIASIVSLTLFSLIDTLEFYSSSYEYRPIICLHETHSDEESTYYSFGYSITYHYGEEVTAEYRLFNLIPFYKK